MNWIPRRMQIGLVAAGYAAVVVLGAALIGLRYWQYARHPEDVAASSGMWAGGDMILAAFLGGLLLVPTLFLVFVIRQDEAAYVSYSKWLVGVALSAPLSVGLLAIPGDFWGLGLICILRIVATPFAVLAYVVSWAASRYRGASRRILCALLIEVLTVGSAIALLVFRRG